MRRDRAGRSSPATCRRRAAIADSRREIRSRRRERRAAVGEIVLAVDLEPGARAAARPRHAAHVRRAQADAGGQREGAARASSRRRGPGRAVRGRPATFARSRVRPSAAPTCRPSCRMSPLFDVLPFGRVLVGLGALAGARVLARCRNRSGPPWRCRSTFPVPAAACTAPAAPAATDAAAKPSAMTPAIAA